MKLEAERSATADPGPVLLSVADLVEWQDAAVMEWHADPDGTEARLEERGWPAGPTAFGLDTGNGVADRGLHDGRAVIDINGTGFAGVVDKVYLGHDRSC